MLRLVTRLAHSRSQVELRHDEERDRRLNRLPLPNPDDWTLVPTNARLRYKHLLELQPKLLQASEKSPRNLLVLKGKRGLICTGTAYNYVREALGAMPEDSLLRIGLYPLPTSLIEEIGGTL